MINVWVNESIKQKRKLRALYLITLLNVFFFV